jgi:hypothetical protein
VLIACPEAGLQPEDCDANEDHAPQMQPDNLHGFKRFMRAGIKFISKGKSGVSLITSTEGFQTAVLI